MIVRRERQEDEAEIARVIDAAFGDRETSAFAAQIRASPGYVPELAFVAEEDGEIVAHTMLSWVRLAGPDIDVLILTPMSVRPDRQRQGVGGKQIEAALAAADGAESRSCSSRAFRRTTRSSASCRQPSSASSGRTRGSPTRPGWRAAGAYDPALRGRVVYPAFFPGPPVGA